MQDTVRHKGKIRITYAALKRALLLPDDARIISVFNEPFGLECEEFVALVECDQFPQWASGERVPMAEAEGCLLDTTYRKRLYFE